MATVAIVFHSGFGHTKVVAECVQRGLAGVPGIKATLIAAAELPAPAADRTLGGRWAELDAADCIVMGCPTYMGSISAEFKRFMESSSGLWFKQAWKDKLAAGFTNSGGMAGDKLNSLIDLVVFASQHGMIWISQGIFYDKGAGDPAGLNRTGSWVGLATQSDPAGPDATPPVGDRRTAELFGKRIGELTSRWVGQA